MDENVLFPNMVFSFLARVTFVVCVLLFWPVIVLLIAAEVWVTNEQAVRLIFGYRCSNGTGVSFLFLHRPTTNTAHQES